MVFTGHYFRNFAPDFERSANGTVFFTLFNGPAAVILFFVLSGFVLSWRPILTGGVSDTIAAAAKRWPRLAGPVILSSLAYIFGALSGAFPRPGQFAAGAEGTLPIIYWGFGRHAERIPAVIREASFKTFFHGSAKFNDVLWSMQWEFIGSFLVLSMALLICLRLPPIFRFSGLAAITIAASAYHPYLSCFAVGMIFCLIHQNFGRRLIMANGVAVCLALLAAFLFSYNVIEPAGLWAWCASLSAGSQLQLWVGIQTTAALCVLGVALYNPAIRSLLSGTVGSLLGRMSFPIYLLHLFVLCSFTSWMCILAHAQIPPLWLVFVLYPATATVLFLVAYPLMQFDGWWVNALNAATRRAQRTLIELWPHPAVVADEAVR